MPKENTFNAKRKAPTIAELYPELSMEQQEEAEYFLRRYLDLIKRIYERVEREKQQKKANQKAAGNRRKFYRLAQISYDSEHNDSPF